MNVEVRKTAAGTEYWDNEAKRVRFVPAGQEPDFEVTENPKSMIMGVDLANGPDHTVNGEEVDKQPDFNSMTVKELKDYAAELSIELPEDVKKKDDIIKYLSDGK